MKHSTLGLLTAFLLGTSLGMFALDRYNSTRSVAPTTKTITIDKPVFIIPMQDELPTPEANPFLPARPDDVLGSTLGPI